MTRSKLTHPVSILTLSNFTHQLSLLPLSKLTHPVSILTLSNFTHKVSILTLSKLTHLVSILTLSNLTHPVSILTSVKLKQSYDKKVIQLSPNDNWFSFYFMIDRHTCDKFIAHTCDKYIKVRLGF